MVNAKSVAADVAAASAAGAAAARDVAVGASAVRAELCVGKVWVTARQTTAAAGVIADVVC